jgi:hypothetical protein
MKKLQQPVRAAEKFSGRGSDTEMRRAPRQKVRRPGSLLAEPCRPCRPARTWPGVGRVAPACALFRDHASAGDRLARIGALPPGFTRRLRRASSIGVDARLIRLDPPGTRKAAASERAGRCDPRSATAPLRQHKQQSSSRRPHNQISSERTHRHVVAIACKDPSGVAAPIHATGQWAERAYRVEGEAPHSTESRAGLTSGGARSAPRFAGLPGNRVARPGLRGYEGQVGSLQPYSAAIGRKWVAPRAPAAPVVARSTPSGGYGLQRRGEGIEPSKPGAARPCQF